VYITAFAGGPLETIGYLVYDRQGGESIIIDAPFGSTRRYVEALARFQISLLYIVNTHGHWDHTADNVPLVAATGAPLCAHSWDATRLANPHLAVEDQAALPVPSSRADRSLQDGEALAVGSYTFTVLHTPGHTPGSICLYEESAGVLFTGDTLFRQAVGRTDFAGGNALQLARSLKRLAQLPEGSRIYPGHGLSTTIGDEKWLLQLATLDSD